MSQRIGLTGSTGSLGKKILKNKKKLQIYLFKGDVRNKHEVYDWINRNNLNVIIHLAAIVPIKDVNKNRKKAKEVNFKGTKHIVDACIKKKIKWFFFVLTSHVYGSSRKKISEKFITSPISFYGKTKLLAENYLIKNFKLNGINFCIGRIFSTTNKDQKKNYLVPDLKHKIKKTKKRLLLKNLNHYRDFISMDDISKIIFILYKKKYNGILNLGNGRAVFLKDIAKIIAKKFKKEIYFSDNKKTTYLVANIKKLSKICKLKLSNKIEELIF